MEIWTCQKQGYILEVQDPIQCSKSKQEQTQPGSPSWKCLIK